MAKIINIKVPSPGESITEVEIAAWLVEEGSYVSKDQEVAEIESDKATLPLIAEEGGKITFNAQEGDTIAVGEVACSIDTSVAAPKNTASAKESAGKAITSAPEASTAAPEGASETSGPDTKQQKSTAVAKETGPQDISTTDTSKVKVSPVAARMMEEHGLSVEDVIGGLKRIGRKEVEMVIGHASAAEAGKPQASREVDRQRMSSLRRKLSERLVAVKNETAMLTTFNECDMSEVIRLRKQYQKAFTDKHGVKLGFMSFFVKAVTVALKAFPRVNSQIDGEEVISTAYCDVGIAVQTDKGLMVPVLRNAESLTLAEIEKGIMDLAGKARAARISLDEMSGGTFTITNGGVFGSMMSTPILNPPQSAILGMHNITERPVAIEGQVVIRPMMYLALSYDHRLIDGRDSVSFLVKVKESIEQPAGMLFGGNEPDRILLGL